MNIRGIGFVLGGFLVATVVFGADQPAAETGKDAAKEPAYRPLILPDKPPEPAVPSPKQELPPEKAAKTAPAEADSAVRPTGIFILPDADDKKNKQELWIYTQPQEEAALAEKRREEDRRIAQAEQDRGDKKLPSWAVDPEYRKYTQEGGSEPEKGLWKADSSPHEPGWLFSDPSSAAAAESARDVSLNIGGISLEAGSEPAKSQDLGLTVAPAAVAKPEDSSAANIGSLYQSNKKEKRVEDFHSGVNKPTTTEREPERHHKPQKPL